MQRCIGIADFLAVDGVGLGGLGGQLARDRDWDVCVAFEEMPQVRYLEGCIGGVDPVFWRF